MGYYFGICIFRVLKLKLTEFLTTQCEGQFNMRENFKMCIDLNK